MQRGKLTVALLISPRFDVKGARDGIVLMKEWETESWKVVQCNMPFTEPLKQLTATIF